VDVDGRSISFSLADGSTVTQPYDLCVGADGAGSAVRAALQSHNPDMSVEVTDSGREYKTYGSVRGDIEPDGEFGRGADRRLRLLHASQEREASTPAGVAVCAVVLRAEFKGPGATLHLWTTNADAWTTLTAHSNPDGTYSGTMSLKTGEHATLTSTQQVEELLRSKFQGVPDHWIPDIAQQVVKETASPAG
jgi:ubiquitin carboxyl-terminal hydrolase 48